ncbi:unnamed protein product [Bubo scandiacus]
MAATGNDSFVGEGMTPPQRILFPPEKICMEWQQRQRAGAGLHNMGNTCFLNSVLQCLTYTPPLANYLLSREHSQSCRQQGFCMMCRMERHVNDVLQSSGRAIQPWAIVSVLTRIGEHFKLGMQEDAHEFLRLTVAAMQEACLSGSSNLDMASQSTTIVHQIFAGFLRSRVTCLSCNMVSDYYEAFLDVPLHIKAASSVTAALENFVKPEQLDGENGFKCSRCDKMVAASKRFTVHHAPKVFTVCLNRYEDFTSRKISKFVEYPEYLDLRPYMSQTTGEPLLYSLYAVLVHHGAICHAGHYYCYTKASNGLWYVMDDSSVDRCDIDTVLRQQAYLLFYIRCSESQLGQRAYSSPTPSYAPSFLSRAAANRKQAASSVTAALENFVKPEQLDGENGFKCSRCDKMVAASKRFTVHHAPKVFTVCLNRYEDFTSRKISKFVEYPEYLDLRPYMSQTAGEPLLYSLYAVLVHHGAICHAGHYYCYTKASNGLWYVMDDSSVDRCDIDTVLRQQAYLLFYVR